MVFSFCFHHVVVGFLCMTCLYNMQYLYKFVRTSGYILSPIEEQRELLTFSSTTLQFSTTFSSIFFFFFKTFQLLFLEIGSIASANHIFHFLFFRKLSTTFLRDRLYSLCYSHFMPFYPTTLQL